jgi:hypothetical protein
VDGQITRRKRTLHLMCTTPFWGITGAVACGYFSYLAYARLRDGEFSWSHEWESIAASAIWVVLMVALLSETRCWRERTFFGLLLLNFTLAFTLGAWRTAPIAAGRDARKISLVLWLMATLASLMTVPTPAQPRELHIENKEQDRA